MSTPTEPFGHRQAAMTEQLSKEEIERLTAETSRPLAVPPRADNEAPKSGDVLPSKKSGGRKRLILLAILILIGGGAAYKGYDWYTRTRFLVSTDDAYVRADMAVIAAKVSGYISSVSISDNQPVRTGDLLVSIDNGDYRLAVDAARRKVETQNSTIERIAAQVRAQAPVIEQARAQLTSAEADAVRAAAEFERANNLLRTFNATPQRVEQARADRDRSAAAVLSARAAVSGANATLAVLQAQKAEAESARAELQTALDRAERDLSFTEVKAPFDGVIGNKAVQPGQYVQTGTRLLALVPLDSAYVEANFKETQLGALKPGQRVSISVDAYSDKPIEGTVESFAPASGSQFSLLPPENATGNFTKIVQRVPVRIKVPPDVARAGHLRPGLSVVVEVHTRADR
ncbi:MAG: rane fusion protein multidrug efflux system [Methylobacteriaceae bacterium]|nr:rane fusion protein multidrug efflux system [Methylobacteriaceae bacterium]